MKTGCGLFAKDIVRLADFYEACLSLERTAVERSHIVLTAPVFELVIHAIPRKVASRIDIQTPPIARAETPIKPVFEVDDLNALRSTVGNHGGVLGPIEKAWQIRGATVLDALDPEGNVIQFRQPSGSEATP